jgi:hypothetical protein
LAAEGALALVIVADAAIFAFMFPGIDPKSRQM